MDAQHFLGDTVIDNLVAHAITVGGVSLNDAGGTVPAGNLEHRHIISYVQAGGADVAATAGDGYAVYACKAVGGATVKSVQVICQDAPSAEEDDDKEFTVDVKVTNAEADAPASILDEAISVTGEDDNYEVKAGALKTTDLAAGDVLLVVVAATGSTGTQGQGLLVQIEIDEQAS